MYIRMTTNEISLLSSLLRCAANYLEFGSGGSTVLAASLVKGHVWSVDLSVEWLENVQREINPPVERVSCEHADIGPVGLWGYPLDYSRQAIFPNYYARIWEKLTAKDIDFVLVDGRFRIASFCETS